MSSTAVPAVAPWLELSAIGKRFGRTVALDAVDLSLGVGEIVGLLGENGAGKSTLMNVLFGMQRPDAGRIRVDGVEIDVASPATARRHGIGMVHQHFTLVPDLTVVENFALADGGLGWLWTRRARAEARLRRLAAEVGVAVEPGARVGDLSVGDQQRLEILKALDTPGVRLLILDEPTACLTPQEVAELFALLRRLRASGMAVVFISHKLAEVLALTDRIVVLRRGQKVAERPTTSVDPDQLGELMVGRLPAPEPSRARAVDTAAPWLRVRGLEVPGGYRRPLAVRGASLEVRGYELVGLIGVDGNGQSELLEALIGLRPATGTVEIGGCPFRPRPAAAIAAGVGYVPGDRRQRGLAVAMTCAENLLLKHQRRAELGRGVWLRRAAVRSFAAERLRAFDVRPADPDLPASALSGGNQQRLVLARELAFGPRLILADNPSRGLDLAATGFVHRQLRAARDRGAAVLVASTDLDEVLALADRILVMYEGRIRECPERTPAVIGRMMGGAPC